GLGQVLPLVALGTQVVNPVALDLVTLDQLVGAVLENQAACQILGGRRERRGERKGCDAECQKRQAGKRTGRTAGMTASANHIKTIIVSAGGRVERRSGAVRLRYIMGAICQPSPKFGGGAVQGNTKERWLELCEQA